MATYGQGNLVLQLNTAGGPCTAAEHVGGDGERVRRVLLWGQPGSTDSRGTSAAGLTVNMLIGFGWA